VVGEQPDAGRRVDVAGVGTSYLEAGTGPPVVLVHGSGPGVSAYANWRLTLPALGRDFRCLAPDLPGFGSTDRRPNDSYGIETWAAHLVGFLDALGLDRVSVVGNSMGGAVALRMAARHPDRVDRLVLMGSVGVPFAITEGLDRVWGYQPSVANMRALLDLFAYSRELVTDELAELRYRASIEPGRQESFATMFPAPRQRWVDRLCTPDDEIAALPHPTLLVHGRDDRIIPLSTSLRLLELLDDAQLHVFGRCGHWTQIEHADAFVSLVRSFLTGGR